MKKYPSLGECHHFQIVDWFQLTLRKIFTREILGQWYFLTESLADGCGDIQRKIWDVTYSVIPIKALVEKANPQYGHAIISTFPMQICSVEIAAEMPTHEGKHMIRKEDRVLLPHNYMVGVPPLSYDDEQGIEKRIEVVGEKRRQGRLIAIA